MKIYTILFHIFIVILYSYLNNFVFAFTKQEYDPDLVRDVRRIIVDIFQNFYDLDAARKLGMLQDEIPKSTPFYCDGKNGPGKRSSVRPTSIHQLRPGDIDIVAAMGDSITGGTGIIGTHLGDIPIENRGMVFTIGGEATWRKYTTLPNILKEFNRNLYGYSLRNANSRDRASKFNVAEGAAESYDMLYQAKVLRQRLIHDPKVNMTHDWKLVTIFIGGIDLCHFSCYEKTTKIAIDQYETDLVKALRYLRDNIPRLMVNLIPPPNMRALFRNKRSTYCSLFNSLICPCYTVKPKKWLDRAENIIFQWYKRDHEVCSRDEFHTDEFTVNVQSFITNFTIPTLKNGMTDLRYFAIDCMHFSQRLNRLGAIALWNNMLEYDDEKSGMDPNNYVVKCPTEEMPFIATKRNKKIIT